MNGLLIVNKPAGLTSFDVVAKVRKAAHEKRIGHAGTLDPFATGVLPLAIGKATRVVEFLSEAGKEYRAGVILGAATDTFDRDGQVTERYEGPLPAREEIEKALEGFRGVVSQLPPMHSAVKHQGKRLYELARAGIEVERQLRQVTIYSLLLVDYEPPLLTLDVACSKGTYIRTLAYDLGNLLGCGAYVESLVRTRHGPFELAQALSLEEVQQLGAEGKLEERLLPFDAALAHLPRLDLGADEAANMLHGRRIDAPAAATNTGRAYGPDGDFLGIVRWDAERNSWKPQKVLIDHGSNN